MRDSAHAQTRLTQARKRHTVDTKRGVVIYHNGGRIEVRVGAGCQIDVLRINRCLEGIRQTVRLQGRTLRILGQQLYDMTERMGYQTDRPKVSKAEGTLLVDLQALRF